MTSEVQSGEQSLLQTGLNDALPHESSCSCEDPVMCLEWMIFSNPPAGAGDPVHPQTVSMSD
jgi:hypothetical protein